MNRIPAVRRQEAPNTTNQQIKIVSQQQIRSTIIWCIQHLVRTLVTFVLYRISHDTSWYQGIAYLVHCISTTAVVHVCMFQSDMNRIPAVRRQEARNATIRSRLSVNRLDPRSCDAYHTWYAHRLYGIAYRMILAVPRYSLPGTLHFYYVVRTCTAVVVCRADSTTILVCTTMK